MPVAPKDLHTVIHFTDDGVLHGDTSNPAWSKVGKSRLSPSRVGDMKGCHAMYVAKSLLPRLNDPFGPAEQGSAAHAVLEELFGLEPHERTKDAARQILRDLKTTHPEIIFPEPQDLATWRAQVWEKAEGEFAINDPATINPVGLEYSMSNAMVAGIPFAGIIDRLERVHDDTLRIVDYKTGAVPDEEKLRRFGDKESDQQLTYVLAGRSIGLDVHQAELHYTRYAVTRTVDVSEAQLSRVQGQFEAAWSQMNAIKDTGTASTQPGGLCNWCPLALACPSSIAGKKKPVATDEAKASASLGIKTLRRTMNTPIQQKEDAPMTYPISAAEAFPSEESLPDGSLNMNSYAATGVVGMAAKAVELLGAQDKIAPVTPTHIQALARTFNTITLDVQSQLSGKTSAQSGLSTRIRAAFYAVLDMQPLPFGQDEEAWRTWQRKATQRCVIIVTTAAGIWADGIVEEPWKPLATSN